MNETGGCVSTTSYFTKDENGNIGLGQQFCLRAKGLHDRASAYEERVIADLFDVLACERGRGVVARQNEMSPNRGFELLFLEWPDQEILGSESHCLFLLY